MKTFKNTSNKIIGFGRLTVLPGETITIPKQYENNPALAIYTRLDAAVIVEVPEETPTVEAVESVLTDETVAEEEEEEVDEETLRKARLASLKTISDEELAALAKQLGINPMNCMDQADVKKKVRAALRK